MTFKEWVESRSPLYWWTLSAKMEKAQIESWFRKEDATTWVFRGESAEFPVGADRHQVFAWFLYKKDGGDGAFEKLGKELSVERLKEVWEDNDIP